MARTTYQTYTQRTPIDSFRDDLIHREAICRALAGRYPDLIEVAEEAAELVTDIDGRRGDLQRVEDDLIRARAVQSAERVDVVDVYKTLRSIMGIHAEDTVFAFLPDAPSRLGKLGAKKFVDRVAAAIENLGRLAEDDPLRVEYRPSLERELAEYQAADKAEDQTKARLRSVRLGLLVYKSELASTRDAQLGVVQTTLGDRAKTTLFTLPWRRRSSTPGPDDESEVSSAGPV